MYLHARQLDAPLLAAPSAAELARSERALRPSDGRRLLAGRALLRAVLAAEDRCAPSAVRLDERDGRAPRWERPTGRPVASFSLSRAHVLAVVALARALPSVGVDVEPLPGDVADRPTPPSTEVELDLVLTERERHAVSAAETEHRETLFRLLWTRKEAVVKADGRGLTVDPRTVDVGLPRADSPWTTVRLPDGPGFRVRSFGWPAGHVCAVAVPLLDGAPDVGVAALPLSPASGGPEDAR